jgi:hypothetical protein
VAEQLRRIADMIEDGIKGGQYYPNEDTELLWEREHPENGGFRMGNRSLICDAYYGAKDFFEVCSISKDDIESQGFDSGSLDENDMVRIASKMDDLILEGCDYWNALDAACEYWEIPRKEYEDEVQ